MQGAGLAVLAAPAFYAANQHFRRSNAKARVLIVGAGSAGINLAARLSRMLVEPQLTIVDPSPRHFYQPGFTMVAAGVFHPDSVWREQADLIPAGVRWVRDSVISFEPGHNRVRTSSRGSLSYDFLVLSPGLELRFDLLPGITREQLGEGNVHSIYDFASSAKCWHAVQQFAKSGGRAIFTDTWTKVKCGGAPKKINLITEDACRLAGTRERARVDYFTNSTKLFEVDFFCRRLDEIYAERQIAIHSRFRVREVNPSAKTVTFEKYEHDEATGAAKVIASQEEPYDFLHVVPPMTAPASLRQSPLCTDRKSARQADWVPTDPATLIHKHYPNVVVCGDAAGIPTSKTGAAIRMQAPVAADNLIARMEDREPLAHYNGYTACPVVTGYGKVLLAEFDYQKVPTPSLPFVDASREQSAAWFLKRHVLKPLYFEGMLRGLV